MAYSLETWVLAKSEKKLLIASIDRGILRSYAIEVFHRTLKYSQCYEITNLGRTPAISNYDFIEEKFKHDLEIKQPIINEDLKMKT